MLTTFYPPHNFGGDGIAVQRLAHALARRGHEVHVLYSQAAYEALAERRVSAGATPQPGVHVHALRGGVTGRLDLVMSHQIGRPLLHRNQLRSILDRGSFDVIHFHNVSLIGGPGIFGLGHAVKLCTLHDYWFVCPMHVLWRFDREPCTQRTCMRCTIAGGRPPQLWRYTKALERAARHIDAFVTGSEVAANLHKRNGFPAPLHCIPHFPEVGAEEGEVEEIRHDRRPYFLCVGRLEKLKGVQVLIELFRRYRAADLLIAGSGTYEPALRSMAKDLDHVRFLGWVGQEKLFELYRNAVAVLLPSLAYETFGLVAVESFAAGTPVIVNAGTAFAEAAGQGGGLIYSNPDELMRAVTRLQDEPGLRRRMGVAARQIYLERYTEDAHIQRYMSLIEQLQMERRVPSAS
jgi:glycosyltransferase involved in cell wall biosynthesis